MAKGFLGPGSKKAEKDRNEVEKVENKVVFDSFSTLFGFFATPFDLGPGNLFRLLRGFGL